jgi:chloride channel protein, CIC family
MEEQREESILRVEDAMQPPTDPVLNAEDSLEQAQRLSAQAQHDVLLVRLRPTGWSSISKAEIKSLVDEGRGAQTLESVLTADTVPSLHPDLPLDTALRYVDRWPVVPVVHRADLSELQGVITQRDVLERYRDFGGE